MITTIVAERPDTDDALALLQELDTHLHAMPYPAESRHAFSVERLLQDGVAFYVTRADGKPAACGGIKLFAEDYAEVKRMYVRPEFRGLGLGKSMLGHLETHAQQTGIKLLRLETGIYQKDAIGLYESYGFQRRGPFGEYKEDPMSIYFEKQIGPAAMRSVP
ncbi:MAG TPA: GNAT family N-acetyltransferase [Pyrinomonadaceae bacterium]